VATNGKASNGKMRIINGYTPLVDIAREAGLANGAAHYLVKKLKLNRTHDKVPDHLGRSTRQVLVRMDGVPVIYEELKRNIPKHWQVAYEQLNGQLNDPTKLEHATMVQDVQAAIAGGGKETLRHIFDRYDITELSITATGVRIQRMVPVTEEIPLE
jgi:hypothetical protein